MTVLYVGNLWYGSTALWRRDALIDIGLNVISIDSSMRHNYFRRVLRYFSKYFFNVIPDFNNINVKILSLNEIHNPDILWIDKGLIIKYKTLLNLKKKMIK